MMIGDGRTDEQTTMMIMMMTMMMRGKGLGDRNINTQRKRTTRKETAHEAKQKPLLMRKRESESGKNGKNRSD